jgi:hypothetical protein
MPGTLLRDESLTERALDCIAMRGAIPRLLADAPLNRPGISGDSLS